MRTSTPPPATPQDTSTDLETRLDAEIARIKSQISSMRTQKAQLASSILASSHVQSHIATRKVARGPDALQARLDKASEEQTLQNDQKFYRMAAGVTAFPFTDPAPERRDEPTMLGIRIDLSTPNLKLRGTKRKRGQDRHEEDDQAQAGQQLSTYFVMLRRLQDEGVTYLKVQHHTIPGHINVEGHSNHYLALPDTLLDADDEDAGGDSAAPNQDGEETTFQDDSGIDVTQDIHLDGNNSSAAAADANADVDSVNSRVAGNGQDVHKFVKCVRDDLQSWWNRVHSIRYLRHELGLPSSDSTKQEDEEPVYSVHNLEQTTNDARQVRITWLNQELGLLKISYAGHIEKAIVYGAKFFPDLTQESELSEYESDNDSNVVRTDTRSQQQKGHTGEHVRLHEVERLLTVDEQGEKVMVQELVKRLRLCDERVFSAAATV